MANQELVIKPVEQQDHEWIRGLFRTFWAAERLVSRGRVFSADELPGFVAWSDGRPVGLVTMNVKDRQCEIVSLNSLHEGKGIGTALVETVMHAAAEVGCSRVWLVTTNDNLHALAFYQRRGFHLCALYPDSINESRRLKPEIPEVGENGIPIRDELELELTLT